MRITWRSCEWLSDPQRADVEARLEKLGALGADRVEIESKERAQLSGSCIEVRLAGVARKCQLTAVREHPDGERAMYDALEAFERSVGDVLRAAEEIAPASAMVGQPALAGVPHGLSLPRGMPGAAFEDRFVGLSWLEPRMLAACGIGVLFLALVGSGLWWLQGGGMAGDEEVAYRAIAGEIRVDDSPRAFGAVAQPGVAARAER